MNKVVSKVLKVGSAVSMFGYAATSVILASSAGSYISGINTAGGGNLIGFIKSALNTVIALAALVAVGILVYSGIQYILAAGDDGKVEKATKGITYAVIGLVICFVSMLIVQFVLTTLLKVN